MKTILKNAFRNLEVLFVFWYFFKLYKLDVGNERIIYMMGAFVAGQYGCHQEKKIRPR